MITINLFSVDDSGYINEWTYTSLGGNWQPGSLNTHAIVPANSSKLTATWSNNNGPSTCTAKYCRSLLFLYQDDKNQLQLCNSTSDAWTFSSVAANPIAGSGVSLSHLTEAKYPAQLRLFYQISSGSLVAADWVSGAQLTGESKHPSTCSSSTAFVLTPFVTYQILRGSFRVGTSTKTHRFLLLNRRARCR